MQQLTPSNSLAATNRSFPASTWDITSNRFRSRLLIEIVSIPSPPMEGQHGDISNGR
jgi:hypothetical protein